MRLDVRFPIGIMFSIIGLLLSVYGLSSDPAIYARSLGVNVNLGWGVILVGFGLALVGFGIRGRRRSRSPKSASDG